MLISFEMYWVIAICAAFVIGLWFLVWLLKDAKKSGENDWIIKKNKLWQKANEENIRAYDNIVNGSVNNAADILRKNSNSDK